MTTEETDKLYYRKGETLPTEQIKTLAASISTGVQPTATSATNPGTPTQTLIYPAIPGTTYPNFKDNTGTSITVPTSVGGNPVISAFLVVTGAVTQLIYTPVAINLTDYATLQNLSTKATISDIYSKNLLNQNDPNVALGKFLSGSGGGLNTSASYNTSGFIPVTPGAQYTFSAGVRFIEFYTAANPANSTGTFQNIATNLASTQTIPAGANFARASYPIASWATSMVNTGNSVLPYVKFGYSFDSTINVSVPAIVTSLNWHSDGDSISAGTYGQYQPKVASSLTLNATNSAIPGTKMGGNGSGDTNSMWQDVRVNAIPTTTNILTMLCGTNDWAQNEPIGDINRINADTSTFIGALNIWLAKVYARVLPVTPTLQIFMMTTTVGRRYPAYPTSWGADGFTNGLGLTTSDYAEALRQWSKMWNLKVIDTNALWNSLNYTKYMNPDGTDGLHPMPVGLDLMSMEIIDRLKNRIRFN